MVTVTRHELKTWPKQFSATLSGFKKHEVRVNDRNYQEGDELLLREWNPDTQRYTGRHVLATISYMTKGGTFGLPENLCVMSVMVQYWSVAEAA
jgi:hypothetical protein